MIPAHCIRTVSYYECSWTFVLLNLLGLISGVCRFSDNSDIIGIGTTCKGLFGLILEYIY